MALSLSDVKYSDIALLVRSIDYPAMQDGPLYRIMFNAILGDDEREDIVIWYTISMERAFYSGTQLCKACAVDGTPLGFAGWVLENATMCSRPDQSKRSCKEGNYLPDKLDVSAWLKVSNALMEERKRILRTLNNVMRLTFMSVHTEHQNQGVGSLMLKWICQEADQHNRHMYVLASPAGVYLYAKFEFETVGQVDTGKGVITSMLRKSR
ncbi:unnamed protein product [Clonostachys chloroleuca]|uniref:N-acetyltransferase domain-containing protein n=1 Tax=Clonostachys chloroleuca TaxID=1926264 RepID=A0AA35LPG0_9HYPO|nr:unnamed protein product [Clonostachys chloroleuca]